MARGEGRSTALPRPNGSGRTQERPGHTPRPLFGVAHQATSREYSTMATSLMMLCFTASTIFSSCWATSLL